VRANFTLPRGDSERLGAPAADPLPASGLNGLFASASASARITRSARFARICPLERTATYTAESKSELEHVIRSAENPVTGARSAHSSADACVRSGEGFVMDAKQVTLVQSTWQKVVPNAQAAADSFYTKLFELDPSLRALFPEDLREQKDKLMATIGRVVSALDRLQDVLPAVENLGRKHHRYGVKREHYDTVGRALLGTLQAGLGEAWNEDVKRAWATAYGTLAQAMLGASSSRTAEAPQDPRQPANAQADARSASQ
jgi:hemoglobin-like flavoprotein